MVQKKKLKEGKGESILYQRKQSVSSKAGTSGITLVALVVTVVVLLILAGITIMYVMGDNGVFGKAKNAKDQTERATFEERLNLATQDAVMERAINGGLLPEEYFDILKKHGIISDVTVPGGNISSPTENTDGSKTYEITSDDDYIFEVTIYPDGKVETEVIGKDGNIEAKIRSILVTNKTKTSIDIQVSARLQGGTVKAYYKKASEVTAGEAEDNIAGYEEIALDSTNLTGKAQSLEAGQEYKIKAILEKEGKVVSSKSINVKTGIAVSSITLNKPEATIGVGKTLTLEAQVLPNEAEEKGITWSTSDSSVVAVDQNGKITGVKAGGPVTITATSKDVTTVKATCSVTVEDLGTDWGAVYEAAKEIANDSSITSSTTQTTKNGILLKVGETYKVKYEGSFREVRLIGFKQDDLVDKTVYGGNHEKASLTFEFMDCLGTHNMNGTDASTSTNANGWAATEMRKWLNGYTSNEAVQNVGINGIAKTLADNMGDNKENSGYKYIKQVKKQYIKTYNDASSNMENGEKRCSYDYLWLLAASEIFATGYQEGGHAVAITTEGDQYKYYADLNPTWNDTTNGNPNLVKKNNGSAYYWWLRSPYYGNATNFCSVNNYRLWQL